jgi:hypothetical protein
MKTSKPRVVHAIDFRILPLPDTVLMLDGQRYVAIGSRLHRKPGGTDVPLITWRSHCAECGVPFECHTTLKGSHPNRRCPEHHSPGTAVTRQGQANQKKFRTGKWRRKPASPTGR